MSDESAEGSPSNRPGTNADTSANPARSGGNEGQEKSGRKRRRKPRNRKRKGIQANSDGTLDTADSAVGKSTDTVGVAESNTAPNSSASKASASGVAVKPDQDGSPFEERSNSKRARRRRGRRGRQRREGQAAQNQTVSGENKPSSVNEAGSDNAGQRRRQTRRPGRAVPKEQGQHTQGHNHGHNRRQVKNFEQSPQIISANRNANSANQNQKGQFGNNNQQRGKSSGQNAGRKNKQHSAKKQQSTAPSSQVPLRRRDAYAALDLGTNNCRLLVAVAQQPGRFQVIDAFSRIVRLGEGLASSGRLNDAAMDRAVEALKACSDKLASRSVKGVRLIANEACRRAENGAEFLKRVETEAGLKLEIVDQETEARLAVAGCSSLVDRKAKGAVLFDIGGGSSELALLDLRKHRRHDLSRALVSWTSLPHGVVTLSEKHGGGKDVTREVFDNMVDEISHLLHAFEGRDELAEAASEGEVHLLGTSGTVTTLAGIHLKLPRYDRRQVDGTWMVSKDVDAMIDALVEMDFEQRVQNPCIGRERADSFWLAALFLLLFKSFGRARDCGLLTVAAGRIVDRNDERR